MSIVNFGVSSSEGLTLFVEAHGCVYKPEDFSDLITEITTFYVSYEDDEDSEWMEIDETFLAANLGEEAFIELLSQIEQSLLEDYHSEKENDDD